MALTINTNINALNAQTNLSRTQAGLSQAINRLSSGLRVNTAKDDAAGLAIAKSIEMDVRALRQGERNANDGVSLLQTAQSGLLEVSSLLTRMRELAVQSANGTLGTSERANLNAEYGQLLSEVDRIANSTTFNGVQLINGSGPATNSIQVGPDAGGNNVISFDLSAIDANASSLTINGTAVATVTNANSAISALDTAIGNLTTDLATLGANESRLTSAISNNRSRADNLEAAKSRIVDADFAAETSNLSKFNILQQAGVSVLAQANAIPQSVLSLLG
jgi:flagellin